MVHATMEVKDSDIRLPDNFLMDMRYAQQELGKRRITSPIMVCVHLNEMLQEKYPGDYRFWFTESISGLVYTAKYFPKFETEKDKVIFLLRYS